MTDEFVDPQTGEITEQPAAAPPQPKRRRTAKKKGNGRVPVPADEGRREKFERLAEQRFGKIVAAFHVLRKIGRNQGAYEYGEADVEQIRVKLQAELDETLGELKRRGKPPQTKLFGN